MKRFTLIFLTVLTAVTTYTAAQKSPAKKKTASKAKSAAASSLANGKLVYTQNCLTCHQADGGGVSNMNPPLIKTTYVLGDKMRLAKIVLNGFSEKVEIDGDIYSNIMPSLNYLSNQQIADVLTYVRSNFGNKASAVTVAEVAKARTGK
jgi:mono/diheme cytochrome c family protein